MTFGIFVRAEAYVITLPAAKNLWRANYPVIAMNDWWRRWRRRGLLELYRIAPSSVRQNQETLESTVTPWKFSLRPGFRWLARKACVAAEKTADHILWMILGR